ncbi:MAG TPA: MoxR family ATPase [Gaiellaceae bacterium]|nr:MoxR family ATPase [Gaiellaceae bacterium]
MTEEAKAAVPVQELATAVADAVEQAIIGKREAVELVLFALLADGHVLIEDLPGLGKTLLARSFAQVCAMDFARIQFTPDLIPSDITGASIYDRSSGSFTFEPGPIFTNILLADEINRAPGKTQAALLEGMEERQVTLENTTRQLGSPFLVLATQNPIEYEGTYPLPEAQLDRFLVRIAIGYPSEDAERDILLERSRRRSERIELEPVCDRQALRAMQAAIERVHVAPPLAEYAVAIARATRHSPQLAVGASPRGSLALMKLARARAAYLGRDFVTPDDIKAVSVPALAHRLTLAPELWVQRIDPGEVVRAAVASVPVPVLDESS